MTIQEAIQTVHSNPPSLNVYYLDKNGTINVIQEAPTSSSMLVLVEEEIRIKNVQSTHWWTFGEEMRDFGSYDIPNPLPFDHRSNLDKKKKKQIYDQYKRSFQAVVEQLTNYGEDSSRTFKIAEEATGAALSTTGVVLTIIFPPAGGLGLIGLAVTTGSAMQALYGWVRTFIAFSDEDFLKLLEKDTLLKTYMKIVDLIGVIYALKGIPKIFSYFQKYDPSKVKNIIDQLSKHRYELRELEKSMKKGVPHNPKGFMSNVEHSDLLKSRIISLEKEWREELEKIKYVRNAIINLSDDLPSILAEVLDLKNIKHFFNDGMGALFLQFFSLYANLTEGHGVATGTLNDLSKGETIIHDAYNYAQEFNE